MSCARRDCFPTLGRLPVISANPRLGLLTSREMAVLTRLLDGQRAAAIAADLFVSQSTVRNHLSSIYAKLHVNGQVDLLRTLRSETPASPISRLCRPGLSIPRDPSDVEV